MDYASTFYGKTAAHLARVDRDQRQPKLSRDSYRDWRDNIEKAKQREKEYRRNNN